MKKRKLRKRFGPVYKILPPAAAPAPVCPALPRFVRVSVQDSIRRGDLISDGTILSNGGYWETASGFVGKSCLEIKAAMGLTVWACRCVQVGGDK